MAIKVNYSKDPVIARLQRKWDQESEMMCLALQDGDKVDAEDHKAKMHEIKKQISELLGK
jgi:hypothetical protein